MINPKAKVSVKLVGQVASARSPRASPRPNADIIQISGGDGGTGASPLTSIKHAGGPWEIGLAEAHQPLVHNDLRDRVVLARDGGCRRGCDVVMCALLGADEYGFGTVAMIADGVRHGAHLPHEQLPGRRRVAARGTASAVPGRARRSRELLPVLRAGSARRAREDGVQVPRRARSGATTCFAQVASRGLSDARQPAKTSTWTSRSSRTSSGHGRPRTAARWRRTATGSMLDDEILEDADVQEVHRERGHARDQEGNRQHRPLRGARVAAPSPPSTATGLRRVAHARL